MPPPITTAPACSTLSIWFGGPGIPCFATLHRLREQGRQVDDFQLCTCLAHAVVEHHGAERARHRQRLRTGGGSLPHAFLVDGAAATLLHPHPRAAGAAAERA